MSKIITVKKVLNIQRSGQCDPSQQKIQLTNANSKMTRCWNHQTNTLKELFINTYHEVQVNTLERKGKHSQEKKKYFK